MKALVAMLAVAFAMMASAPAYAKYCHDKNGNLVSCQPEGHGDGKGPGDRKNDCES